MCASVNNENRTIDVPFSVRRDNMSIPLKVGRLDFLLQAQCHWSFPGYATNFAIDNMSYLGVTG